MIVPGVPADADGHAANSRSGDGRARRWGLPGAEPGRDTVHLVAGGADGATRPTCRCRFPLRHDSQRWRSAREDRLRLRRDRVGLLEPVARGDDRRLEPHGDHRRTGAGRRTACGGVSYGQSRAHKQLSDLFGGPPPVSELLAAHCRMAHGRHHGLSGGCSVSTSWVADDGQCPPSRHDRLVQTPDGHHCAA